MKETYALLDSGSGEISLCKEQLRESRGMEMSRFKLTEVTASATLEGVVGELVVMSLDESVCEELSNFRTFVEIPVSDGL